MIEESPIIVEQGKLGYRLKIKGQSMKPLIYPEEIVVIKTEREEVEYGQVVAFLVDKEIVIHRIVKKNPEYVITKGDYRPESDGRIELKRIFGQCSTIEKKWGVFNLDKKYWLVTGKVVAFFSAASELLYKSNNRLVSFSGRIVLKFAQTIIKLGLIKEKFIYKVKKAWE